MHIKDEQANEILELWDLNLSGEKEDILSALAEAFMKGAICGAKNKDIAEEAELIYENEDETSRSHA